MRWLMSFAERRGISLSHVLREYSATELNYWRAWDRKEINQQTRIEHLLAQMLSAFYNLHKKKGAPPYHPKDFLFKPEWATKEDNDNLIITDQLLKATSK